jgi:sorting nexin-13
LNALLAREKEAAREKTPTGSVTSPGHRRAGSENILASSPKKSASVGDLSALATDVSEEEDDDGEAYELARMIGDDEPERQRAPRAISASTGDAATSGGGDDDRGAGDDRGGGGGGGGQTLRAEVSEVNIVGKGGSAYAVYTIRVRRVGEHGEDWAVARRFRNFEALHKRLTESRAARDVALPQLPKKRYLLHSLDGPFVEGRRRLLDAYLASILSNDILCVSEEVGEFLSANNVKYGKKKKNAVAAMAKSLTQSVEDVFKSGKEKDKDARGVSNAGIDDVANGASAKGHRRGVSVGALSLRGDDLGVYDGGGELSRSSNPVLERAQSAIDEKDEVAPAGGRRGREDAREDAGVIDAASGVLMDGPLFGLFEALFHLQSKGFVRRTIVTVARQTLDFFVGSAVEDWVSKTLKDIRTPRTAANVVSFVDKSMWPNGAWYNQTKPEDVPALMREIAAADEITRAEVREALLNLGDRGGPLLGVLGARNYTRAALDFLAAARSDLMTRQIGLHVVEAVLDELFPEGRDDDVEDAATRADSTIGEVEAAADDDDPAAGVEAAALELYATTALQYER